MTNDLDNFDPHAWHQPRHCESREASPAPIEEARERCRSRRDLRLFLDRTGASRGSGDQRHGHLHREAQRDAGRTGEFSADYIDPEEWGKLVVLFSRLHTTKAANRETRTP